MDDGSLVHGETSITASKRTIAELMLSPADASPAPRNPRRHRRRRPHHPRPRLALHLAHHQSARPRNPRSLAASHATRVYICNLMTQANESLGLTASQHIEKIFDHAGAQIFDYALINTAPIAPTRSARYAREGQTPIEADLDRIRALGVEPITGNFVHEGEVLRHDYDVLAETILQLALTNAPAALSS